MSSSISAARLALDDILTAATAATTGTLAGVQNTFGTPLEDEEETVIAILGITDPNEGTLTLGPQAPRDERYSIEVAVKVYDPSADDTAADRRAVDTRGFALADAVRSLVEANHTLKNTVSRAHVARQRSDGLVHPVDAAGNRLPGWVIRIDLSISCRARV